MTYGGPPFGADLIGSRDSGSSVRFAQAIMANWLANDVPGIRGGFRIGLATWSELGHEAVAELSRWLQFVPAAEGDQKFVFGRLNDGLLIWAKLSYLPGHDDVGRQTRRYWGHALITSQVPEACRGHSPLDWWAELPFFPDFEAAKAARSGDNGLPVVSWRVPRPAPSHRLGSAQLTKMVSAAFERIAQASTPATPIVLPRDDEAAWGDAAEAYRLLLPSDWGLLPADSGYDGVVAEPSRRYWVVGCKIPGTRSQALPHRPPRSGVQSVPQRWAVELAATANWGFAVDHIGDVERTVELLRLGSPELTLLPPVGLEQQIVRKYGPEVVINAIAAALEEHGLPQPLVDHAAMGMHRTDFTELLDGWVQANAGALSLHLQYLALRGLLSGRTELPSIDTRSRRRERQDFPLLDAWLTVTARRGGGAQYPAGRRHARRNEGDVPGELDRALSELPLGLLSQWALFVFAAWPGAPYSLLLPAGQPGDYRSWRQRTDCVLAAAWQTWLPSAGIDESLLRAANQWIEALARACGGEGAAAAQELEYNVYGPPREPRQGRSLLRRRRER